jgi:hypothetical protein
MSTEIPVELGLFLTKHFQADVSGIRLRTDELDHRILTRGDDDAVAVGDDIFLHRHLSIAPSAAEVGEVGREVARVLQHRRGDFQVAALGALGLQLEDEADRHQARIEATYRPGSSVDPLGTLTLIWPDGVPDPEVEPTLRTRLRDELRRLYPGEVVRIPRLKLRVDVDASADVRALVDAVVAKVRDAVRNTPRALPPRAAPPAGTLEGRRIRLQPPGPIGETFAPSVNPGRQARHVQGTREWTEKDTNSYFRSADDPNKVLEAFHAGEAVVAGRTPGRAHLVVWYGGVTGYVRRRAEHGFVDAPTHFFLFKGGIKSTGTSTTSAVPVDPEFIAFDAAF